MGNKPLVFGSEEEADAYLGQQVQEAQEVPLPGSRKPAGYEQDKAAGRPTLVPQQVGIPDEVGDWRIALEGGGAAGAGLLAARAFAGKSPAAQGLAGFIASIPGAAAGSASADATNQALYLMTGEVDPRRQYEALQLSLHNATEAAKNEALWGGAAMAAGPAAKFIGRKALLGNREYSEDMMDRMRRLGIEAGPLQVSYAPWVTGTQKTLGMLPMASTKSIEHNVRIGQQLQNKVQHHLDQYEAIAGSGKSVDRFIFNSINENFGDITRQADEQLLTGASILSQNGVVFGTGNVSEVANRLLRAGEDGFTLRDGTKVAKKHRYTGEAAELLQHAANLPEQMPLEELQAFRGAINEAFQTGKLSSRDFDALDSILGETNISLADNGLATREIGQEAIDAANTHLKAYADINDQMQDAIFRSETTNATKKIALRHLAKRGGTTTGNLYAEYMQNGNAGTVNELASVLGKEQFNRITARYIGDAFGQALRAEKKSDYFGTKIPSAYEHFNVTGKDKVNALPFDAVAFERALGLADREGAEKFGAIMDNLGPDEAKFWDDVIKAGKHIEQLPMPNSATFLARRFILGGFGSGALSLFGPEVGPVGSLGILYMAQFGVGGLTSPGLLKWMTKVSNPDEAAILAKNSGIKRITRPHVTAPGLNYAQENLARAILFEMVTDYSGIQSDPNKTWEDWNGSEVMKQMQNESWLRKQMGEDTVEDQAREFLRMRQQQQ